MECKFGNIQVYVEQDYDAVSIRAADIFAKALREHPSGAFGFATGGTPVGMYKRLIAMNAQGSLDFSGIRTFNLDEYYPISRKDTQSYHYFMMDNLFNHVNVDPNNIHVPSGEASDIEKECHDYENELAKTGGLQMQLLGIGLNGHIGFNEPADTFSRGTHCVQLDQSTCEANARFFSSIDEVPRQAVTMGIASIMMSKGILLLASGQNKASILRQALTGPITPQVPSSALQLHRHVTVVLDQAAAGDLLK